MSRCISPFYKSETFFVWVKNAFFVSNEILVFQTVDLGRARPRSRQRVPWAP